MDIDNDVVRDKVTKSSAATAAVTGDPGDATVGGVFDMVIDRVDSDQLVTVCN